MEPYDYDLIVIGAGPGGYVAAIRAAQLGAKTAVVEKEFVGGTCLNRGCIPTKTLISATQKLDNIKTAKAYGITVDQSAVTVNFTAMMKKRNDVVMRLRNGVNFLLRKNGVKVYNKTASFVDAHTVSLNGQEQISAKQFIIASGSKPVLLPFVHLSERVVDSNGILELQEIPASLTVLGGGVVGIEYASIFNSLGSQVTVLEGKPSILSGLDSEIVQALHTHLKGLGIQIHTDIQIKQVTETGEVRFQKDGEEQTLASDLVLASLGRVPYLDGLNLQAAGVEYSDKGIPVDDRFLTNQPHIAAIGDVLGGMQLAHLASAQGIVAAEVLLGAKSHQNLDVIPVCVYTNPEIASVGRAEEALQQSNIAYEKSVFPLSACGKAVAMNEPKGMVKVLHEPQNKRILGVHLFAPHATDIIGEAALAMAKGMTAEDVASVIHPHPTIAESLMEAMHLACGTPINRTPV